MQVKDLLDLLSSKFPLEDADTWDNPGMSVGDPLAQVEHVACALDVTPANIQAAHELGCNVLVTHHPIYRQAPGVYTPQIESSSLSGVCTYLAAKFNLSIISMHTNLDKSSYAMSYLANLLCFKWTGRLEEPHGFGALMDVCGYTYKDLAAHCALKLNTQPTIWAPHFDLNSSVSRAVYCSGSTGDLGELAIAQRLDCIICGECGYHKCLELSEAGVGVILLGHDASELPFAHLLADTISEASPDICITVLDEPRRWQTLA